MRAVHPAIRRGEHEDPGPAATNFGGMTPLGSLLGHLVEAPEHRALLEDYPYLRGPYVCFLHDEVAVELRDPFPPAAP